MRLFKLLQQNLWFYILPSWPGLGGHCIPIDPFASWKAKEVGMNTRFIELAGEINTAMLRYVIQKVSESLNSIGKSIKGSNILVWDSHIRRILMI